jgi:hypothetical protein
MSTEVHDEPCGLAALNAEFERLRLAAIEGDWQGHDAILEHLTAFKTPKQEASK